MKRHDNLNISPTENMKRCFNRRRWSDSPTLLRQADLHPNGTLQRTADHELTQSLHDLTEPILQPISKVSSVSRNSLSTSTLQSGMGVHIKSQDSGFNKSASCLSLQSANRKYNHVESKVKKYVQDIKDAEALRKQSLSHSSVNSCVPPPGAKESKPCLGLDRNADDIIDKLQCDIQDKDTLIRALRGSYEDLLLKLAEAENKIDQLRLRSLQRSPARPRRSRQLFPDSFEFQPLYSPERSSMDLKTSCFATTNLSPKEVAEDSCADDSFSPSVSESIILSPAQSNQTKSHSNEVVISVPLGPIQKLYSTSVRLDRVLQPLSHFSIKSGSSRSTPSILEIQSSPQIPFVDEVQAEKEASDGRSEDFGGAKSNLYYTTADTCTNNLYHMTTDTGIEDCIQSATDKDTAENEMMKPPGSLPVGSELKRIPNIPNEDAFSKVQRWRDSLPNDITDRKVEKLKVLRSRRLAPPRKTVGVQTSDQSENVLCFCNSTNSSALVIAETSDNDYAESLEMSECDNFSSEISKNPVKKSWNTNTKRTRSKSVQLLNRHRCCRSAVVTDNPPVHLPSSTSYLSPKEINGSSQTKLRSADKTEKIRRDPQMKRAHCSRVAGPQVTRAMLLDMLLNVQSAHSCCCCCCCYQHVWRERQPENPVLKEKSNQEKVSENALQRCLAEIQKIAGDLNAKLAQNHAGLVNLSCRVKD